MPARGGVKCVMVIALLRRLASVASDGLFAGVKIDVRHVRNQAIRPVISHHSRSACRHKFQRAMHAEMQQNVGFQIMLQKVIKSAERMGRGKALSNNRRIGSPS